MKERGLSERRSCLLIGLSRSGLRYQAHPRDDGGLRERLREIAWRHKRYGYRRALALLRRDHLKVNHKRVHRLWKEIGLQCPVRRKRKRSQHSGSVSQEATHPNHVWTYDFVLDRTSDSRTLKILTLVDEFTRECLAIKVERRLPAKAVIEVLQRVFSERGVPEYLRSDNGPEFIAKAIQRWLKQRRVQTHYIEPGSPWQNAYGESFNGKFRDECLTWRYSTALRRRRVLSKCGVRATTTSGHTAAWAIKRPPSSQLPGKWNLHPTFSRNYAPDGLIQESRGRRCVDRRAAAARSLSVSSCLYFFATYGPK